MDSEKRTIQQLIDNRIDLPGWLLLLLTGCSTQSVGGHTCSEDAYNEKKEIGIRKVLDASVQQVCVLLSKDFVVLVLVSCLIATPVSFYFLHNWLMNYDYRINIGAGVFVASGLVALLIPLVTIRFQAIKAAVANPVKNLRTE